jgi:putative oxidoreductase
MIRVASSAAFGPLILRLGLGAIFVGSGLQKLLGIGGGTGISGTAALFRAVHLVPALPLAIFITYLELVGGVLLVIGGLTDWIAMVLIVEMLVAIWKVHFINGFFLNWMLRPGVGHGFEFNLLLICALLCLILTGPGAWAVDDRLRRRSH